MDLHTARAVTDWTVELDIVAGCHSWQAANMSLSRSHLCLVVWDSCTVTAAYVYERAWVYVCVWVIQCAFLCVCAYICICAHAFLLLRGIWDCDITALKGSNLSQKNICLLGQTVFLKLAWYSNINRFACMQLMWTNCFPCWPSPCKPNFGLLLKQKSI